MTERRGRLFRFRQTDTDPAGADDGTRATSGEGGPAEVTGTGADEAPAAGTRRRSRRAKAVRWVVAIMTALVMLAGGGVIWVVHRLDANMTVVDAFAGLKHRPPAAAPGVVNLLILGSQTRDGQGKGFGDDPGTDLSDNLLLVHLNATHTHATVVSIPRDTMVYEPACKSRSGQATVPAQQQAIIDGAMNLGGPPCAVATVEHLTDIRMDHFVEFDFNSFRRMIDLLGGVEVCVPPGGYSDPFSNLHIRAGMHLITGGRALEFVRTRHGVGDGGDLGRIELQQEFISSLVQKIMSAGTLDDPVKLLSIADAATRALSVDPGLDSVQSLVGLAASLRGLHASDVTFVTMPTVSDPANPNRLLPQEPADDLLWQMLKDDQAWPGSLPVQASSPVDVRVADGTGDPGLASETAASLDKLGFDATPAGEGAPAAATTISYDGSGGAGGAYRLMSALGQAPVVADGVPGPITLTIGPGFSGVSAPPSARRRHHRRHPAASPSPSATASAPAVQTRNGAASICSDMPAGNSDPGVPAG